MAVLGEVVPRPTVVDPVTGIIPATYDIEMARGDPDVFITSATAYQSLSPPATRTLTFEGSGAALNRRDSRIAAIGEAVERYSLANYDTGSLVFGTGSGLRSTGCDVVEPGEWALFDKSQYGEIGLDPFGDDTPISWTPAHSLTHRRERLVPACIAYMPYAPLFPARGEQLVSDSISTGAACGSSLAAALLSGLCEQIERDSFMIVWRNTIRCPRVVIDRRSRLYDVFSTNFARPGLEYVLVRTTLDIDVPCFFGVLVDHRCEPPAIIAGGAAHPDPSRAALKTLIELVQGLKWRDYELTNGGGTVTAEAARGMPRSFKDRAHLYAFGDMRSSLDLLFDHPSDIAISDIPTSARGTATEDLRTCVEILARRGLESLALDITPGDVNSTGLRVARVLVPGFEVMEGDHRLQHLGGRRWRDVPVELGLRESTADVGSVNPVPHPYP